MLSPKRVLLKFTTYSSLTSFFQKRPIYRLGIISLEQAPVHVDELTSARIWQYKLYTTYSANVNINNRLSIKVYYRIYTFRQQNRNNSWKPECVLSFNMGWWILVNCIRQPTLKLKTHSGFHDLFLK